MKNHRRGATTLIPHSWVRFEAPNAHNDYVTNERGKRTCIAREAHSAEQFASAVHENPKTL